MVVELARREKKELRASGSGHSPSDLVCTDGFVVNMDGLDRLLEVSRRTRCLLIFFFCFRFLGPWVGGVEIVGCRRVLQGLCVISKKIASVQAASCARDHLLSASAHVLIRFNKKKRFCSGQLTPSSV